jgi:hypothetical protein
MQRQGILSREEANRARLQAMAEEQQASQLATRQRALGVPAEVPEEETQEEAQQRALAEAPEVMKEILDAVGVRTKEQKEDAAAFADSALQAKSEEEMQFLIDERIRKVQARGGDASETLKLKELSPDLRESALRSLKTAALTTLQREQLGMQREGMEARKAEGKIAKKPRVQSSEILDDGRVQVVLDDNTTDIISPGEEKLLLVKQAKEFGAKLQRLRSGEREAGKAAIAQSVKAYEKLAPIKKNIKNLTEGIRLIQEEGAESGVIAKHFPSMKAASINLDNLQGRLGLDVIADVTFGALSESELAFAKDTALPIGLEGPALVDWLTRKRDAQKVLAQSLTDAALFLGDPGNSIPDYIRMKESQKQPAAAPTAQPAAQALPQGVTEDDIAETMRANNMTREQVLARLGGQ